MVILYFKFNIYPYIFNIYMDFRALEVNNTYNSNSISIDNGYLNFKRNTSIYIKYSTFHSLF